MQYLYMPLRLSFLVLIIGCTLSACKEKVVEQNKDNEDASTLFTSELPQDFLDFYKKFHSDSVFQKSHVIFPLQGRPAKQEEEEIIPEGFTWSEEKWKMHHPLDLMDGSFHVVYTNLNNLITETVSDDSGQFQMVRRFSKNGDDWALIYYKEMGK